MAESFTSRVPELQSIPPFPSSSALPQGPHSGAPLAVARPCVTLYSTRSHGVRPLVSVLSRPPEWLKGGNLKKAKGASFLK